MTEFKQSNYQEEMLSVFSSALNRIRVAYFIMK